MTETITGLDDTLVAFTEGKAARLARVSLRRLRYLPF